MFHSVGTHPAYGIMQHYASFPQCNTIIRGPHGPPCCCSLLLQPPLAANGQQRGEKKVCALPLLRFPFQVAVLAVCTGSLKDMLIISAILQHMGTWANNMCVCVRPQNTADVQIVSRPWKPKCKHVASVISFLSPCQISRWGL